ncbi:MAG: PPP family 3-phenylpropionic acid transporter [Oleiphilaceae bacterium]|jgi:PPP family 3-phenylpropionic acid transporter
MSAYLFLKLSALYFVYFGLLGVMAPYLSLYLEEEGFSLLEIGQLMSLLMITKMVAPLLWGSLADKYNKSILLVRIGAFMTLLCYLGFFWAHTFWSLAFVIILYSFFWNAVLPQIEVITLYNLAEQRNRYSRIRLWGSVGFIFSVALCGWLFEVLGMKVFPWVLLILISAIFIVSLLGFSEVKIKTKTSSSSGRSFKYQLYLPRVMLFFLVCFLLQVSHGAYYTYFSIYLSDLNYSKVQIGWLWALGVIAEVIMFVVMHRWLKQSSIENIMLLSLLVTIIRWVMTALYADSFFIITVMQCLHAFSFGAMHVACIQFVHDNFEQQNQGRAQALYSSLGFGAGGAVGATLSGYIVDSFSYQSAFIFSAIVCFIGVFLVSIMKSRFQDRL